MKTQQFPFELELYRNYDTNPDTSFSETDLNRFLLVELPKMVASFILETHEKGIMPKNIIIAGHVKISGI